MSTYTLDAGASIGKAKLLINQSKNLSTEVLNSIDVFARAVYKHAIGLVKQYANPKLINKFNRNVKKILTYHCGDLFLFIALCDEDNENLIRRELKNLVGLITQPSNEPLMYEKINKIDTPLNEIRVNLSHGWGCSIDDQSLIDLFYEIDNCENPRLIASTIAHKLNEYGNLPYHEV